VPDPRDQAYIDTITDPELREVVTCALTTYRIADVIRVGDALPRLPLHRLAGPQITGDHLDPIPAHRVAAVVALETTANRPLVLLFGSYT
jgi:hypothetical protein